MHADERGFRHKDLTEKIIGIFYQVYNELGYGYAEVVYERALLIALGQAGLIAQRQVPITVFFRGHVVGEFIADMVVEGVVLLELKSVRAFDPSHEAQILNYLRSTLIEV